MKTRNQTVTFIVLTFLISFSMAGIYKLVFKNEVGNISFTILGVLYMFVPAISAIIVKKIIFKESLVKDLLISFRINKWFIVAWLLMPLVIFGTLGVSLLFPGVNYNPAMTGLAERFSKIATPEMIEEMEIQLSALPVSPIWLILIMGLFAGITVNGLAAFGEELGWRGFLLHRFKNMNFLKGSFIIGIIWGIWHAPMILMGHNYPDNPISGVFMMVALCVLISPIIMYITIRSRSVIAAAIMHGTMNATATISIIPITGGNDLLVGIPGLSGLISLAVFTLLIFAYDQYICKKKIMTRTIESGLS